MHALILQGDGKYYVSAVFGIYREQRKKKRYAGYDYFYIVWDEQKTKLIKWPEYLQILRIGSPSRPLTWSLMSRTGSCPRKRIRAA